MHRRRATPRFYVLLILVLVGLFFLLRGYLPTTVTEVMVGQREVMYTQDVAIVVARNEQVTSFDGNGTVIYSVEEGARVKAGETIAEIYSTGYSEKIMKQLETVRQDIRAYHQKILKSMIDNELDRLERNVAEKAAELKNLLKTDGAYFGGVEKQLEEAMYARQEYLRQNRREDPTLNSLYDSEGKLLNTIESWKTAQNAGSDGIVSFYMDGYERFLSPENLSKLTVVDIESVINGKKPADDDVESRFRQDIYRLVAPDAWDALLIGDESKWRPVIGQVYTFQVEGYEDMVYRGTVTKVLKEGRNVMVQLSVEGDMGPMMDLRSGNAQIGIELSGLSVSLKAIATRDGRTGIWVNDVPGGTFVYVEVLSTTDNEAIIEPEVPGSVFIGQRILVK